jgi:hypothetical protein
MCVRVSRTREHATRQDQALTAEMWPIGYRGRLRNRSTCANFGHKSAREGL